MAEENTGGASPPPVTAGGMTVRGLFVLCVVGVIIRAIARLLEWLAQMAISVWEALLLILQWGTVALIGLFVLLAVVGVVELLLKAHRKRTQQRLAMQSCGRPTVEAMRGEAGCSPVDQQMASALLPELAAWGIRQEELKDEAMPVLRERIPHCFTQAANVVAFHGLVTQPLFAMLQAGCPELARRIDLSCQPCKRPMWRIRRAWNRLTFGRLGLSRDDIYTRECPEEIMRNFAKFQEWSLHNVWLMIPLVEDLLPHQLAATGVEPWPRLRVDVPRPTPPRPRSRPPEPVRPALSGVIDMEAHRRERQGDEADILQVARARAEAVRGLLHEPLPWLDPDAILAQLQLPLQEILETHPNLPEVRTLLDQLSAMRSALPEAHTWIDSRLNESDRWPDILNEAFAVAAAEDNLSPETVKGQAMRLYLTSLIASGPSKGETPSRTTSPVSEPEPGGRPDNGKPDKPPADDEAPASYTAPSATQRAEALF